MKFLVVFCFLSVSIGSWSQVFHIDDTSTTLIKTTSQSPAHWYIQVYSDVAVDTSLRWKATHFDNVPIQWVISMDDQTQSHSNVQVGDSADFLLEANQAFAKKLIIGAMLNGTPGHGICYFDVFDPDNRSVVKTISYEFIVTQSTNGLLDLNEESFLEWKDGSLCVKNGEEATFEVVDLAGKIVFEKELKNKLKIADLPKNNYLIIQVLLESKVAIIKIMN
jgi:hypothetical protein